MNFRFDPEDEEYRQEVRRFLKGELPEGWQKRIVSPMLDTHEHDDVWNLGRKLARKMGDRGWLSITWPARYGGQEAPQTRDLILQEELFYHGAPGRDPFGVGIIAPVLIACGNEEQKTAHLGPIAKGEIFWCELWSEPEAGSDLASLRLTAREDSDCYIVNGQKVWTTGAHRVEWGFLLARTDPDLPRHRGISCFLVDMKTPGITINPLMNITGAYGFNEVYFDEVKIPRENLVGEKNQGWRIVMKSAEFERAWIEPVMLSQHILDQIIAYVTEGDNAKSLEHNTQLKLKLSELAVRIRVGRLLSYRAFWLNTEGMPADCAAAQSKVFSTELLQMTARIAIQVLGLYGQLCNGSKWAPLFGDVERLYLGTVGFTIGGGTSEIQRNTIASLGLGMPRS